MPVKPAHACGDVEGADCSAHTGEMQNLRSIREAKGLTQAELAEKANVNQATISKLERGGMNATLDMVYAISRALGVTPVELFALPELHRRALAAISSIDPARREAALVVLEAMASKP